tara:strand:- start:1373 stop:1981 length:609 start_codon:yes stop_codon:yes gene_type:complete
MNNVEILNNVIPLKFQKEIISTIDDNNFEWYFYDSVYGESEIMNPKNPIVTETPGLIHTIFMLPGGVNSKYFNMCLKLLHYIRNYKKFILGDVLRIRIRRTLKTPNHNFKKHNIPHVDLTETDDYKSLIYYVEDSDGDTVLFNNKWSAGDSPALDSLDLDENKRISPKQGRCILFDGHVFHAGNNPINYIKRTVINFDFKIK